MKLIVRIGAALWIANEIRGFCFAIPVFYAMWSSGGTLTAIWLGFCSLMGIALSVFVPMLVLRRMKRPA